MVVFSSIFIALGFLIALRQLSFVHSLHRGAIMYLIGQTAVMLVVNVRHSVSPHMFPIEAPWFAVDWTSYGESLQAAVGLLITMAHHVLNLLSDTAKTVMIPALPAENIQDSAYVLFSLTNP
jgi:hypothetical protein